MKNNYVLIDYENVQVKSLDLLKGDHFRVHVFLGPKNMKLQRDLVIAMQTFGERGKYVTLEAHGKNALDFHIAYYLGVLASVDPGAVFHVISKDTGFDPLLQHLKGKGIACDRSNSVETMPCFKRSSTHKTAAATPAPNQTQGEPPARDVSVEGLVELVVKDLVKRRTARPRTLKTLRGTVHARCGKDLSVETIDAVIGALVEHRYVNVDGTKVTYSLPPEG